MFDAIVFSQQELEKALINNAKNICLCDNCFSLPFSCDMVYYALGDVSAQIAMTFVESIQNNVTFDGFVPEFKAANAPSMPKSHTSNLDSYLYEYEYEYEYRTSIPSSGSGGGSFVSSYRGSGSVLFVNGYGVNLI